MLGPLWMFVFFLGSGLRKMASGVAWARWGVSMALREFFSPRKKWAKQTTATPNSIALYAPTIGSENFSFHSASSRTRPAFGFVTMKIIELDGKMIWFGKWLFIHFQIRAAKKKKRKRKKSSSRSMNRVTFRPLRTGFAIDLCLPRSSILMSCNIYSSINLLTFNAKAIS